VPNQITSSGLQVKTYSEVLSEIITAFQTIYGADINVSSSTPDGQIINIFVQSILDQEDLLVQINNNFDPDLAFGTILDQRVAINGIQRKAGTYTTTYVTIVTSQALTLQGLDLYPNDPYTVSDSQGNEFQLLVTQFPAAAGTYSYLFQAKNPGEVLTQQNTITIPVSVVIGVTSINNPLTYNSLGLNEETDAQLRLRRQQSTSLSSKGYLSGLLGALQNINGVETTIVYENTADTTNALGITPHAIWVIVGGTVADADVATAIYSKRNAGCGLYTLPGPTLKTYNITQADGSIFTVKWNTVQAQAIFLKVGFTSIDGITPPLATTIVNELPNKINPGVGEVLDINEIATFIQQIDPNCLVTFPAGYGLSANNVTFFNTLSPTNFNGQMNLPTVNISYTIF
jgi:hypothetical protein